MKRDSSGRHTMRNAWLGDTHAAVRHAPQEHDGALISNNRVQAVYTKVLHQNDRLHKSVDMGCFDSPAFNIHSGEGGGCFLESLTRPQISHKNIARNTCQIKLFCFPRFRKLKGRCATDQELNGQEVRSIMALRHRGGVRVRDNISAAKHDLCFLRPDWGTDLQVSTTKCRFRNHSFNRLRP